MLELETYTNQIKKNGMTKQTLKYFKKVSEERACVKVVHGNTIIKNLNNSDVSFGV